MYFHSTLQEIQLMQRKALSFWGALCPSACPWTRWRHSHRTPNFSSVCNSPQPPRASG